MSLTLLVYLIGLVNPLGFMFFMLSLIGIIITLFLLGVAYCDGKDEFKKPGKIVSCLTAVLLLVSVLIPSEKTTLMMVAAGAAQRIHEPPGMQEREAKILKLIDGKLDGTLEEASKQAEKAVKGEKK